MQVEGNIICLILSCCIPDHDYMMHSSNSSIFFAVDATDVVRMALDVNCHGSMQQ